MRSELVSLAGLLGSLVTFFIAAITEPRCLHSFPFRDMYCE